MTETKSAMGDAVFMRNSDASGAQNRLLQSAVSRR